MYTYFVTNFDWRLVLLIRCCHGPCSSPRWQNRQCGPWTFALGSSSSLNSCKDQFSPRTLALRFNFILYPSWTSALACQLNQSCLRHMLKFHVARAIGLTKFWLTHEVQEHADRNDHHRQLLCANRSDRLNGPVRPVLQGRLQKSKTTSSGGTHRS